MNLLLLYWTSVAALMLVVSVTTFVAVRRKAFQSFTTLELATVALLICLLHVAVVPWQTLFAKVPGLDALVFSIPYTAIFLLGVRLVPKFGVATLLIVGSGLFGQLLGRRAESCVVAILRDVRDGSRTPATLRRVLDAVARSDVGGRRFARPSGLFLHVPASCPVSLAPVLCVVVRRAKARLGRDRLRNRRLVGMATGTNG